ncbi:hypothetical protein RSO67_03045 [Tardiphaga sp. 709]|nr:hypothetical protein [Tardiphaga sp. 709]WNV10188.1 hypothetical protein RSO67_03045 [Tardiphaga sp. 709]
MCGRKFRSGLGKLLGLVAVDRLDQRVTGREVAIQRPDSNAREPRDLLKTGGLPFSANVAFAVSSNR